MANKPVYGFVELENGQIIEWLRFAESEEKAIEIVKAQHVHVKRCWVEESEEHTTSPLARFAFNQARFVFYTQFTIERDMIAKDITMEQALQEIKNTPNGQKFLIGVSIQDIKNEEKEPGTFMDKNTNLGKWCNDEYGSYVEDFVEL